MTREDRQLAIEQLERISAKLGAIGETVDYTEIGIKALQTESCETCCNGNQEEKAKLCQKSYLAGMEHKSLESCEDVVDRTEAIKKLKTAYFDSQIQSAKNDPCIVDAMVDWAIRQIKSLLPVQPKVVPIAEIRFDDDKLHEIVDEAIKNIEIEPKWIPVSERLPEDRREVLVTAYWHETYQVMMASYFGDGLWWCVPFNNCGEHMQRLKPKAWMPLLEPYKAESEDK